MSYHHVDPDGLAPTEDYPCDRRDVASATGLDHLHLARYAMEPGEQLPRYYHRHERREEALYVLDGRLHVQTADGEREVPAGDAFVVEPGNPHRAFNPAGADAPVVVLGVGAPKSDPGIREDPPGDGPEN